MRRGEIWWADLGEPRGSQPALRRPVLVVQDDLLTQSALGTVMVAIVGSIPARARRRVDDGLRIAPSLR